MNELPLTAVGQVKIPHEHVSRIEAAALPVTIARVSVAVVSPILVALSRLVLWRTVANVLWARSASENEPLVLPAVNAIIPIT